MLCYMTIDYVVRMVLCRGVVYTCDFLLWTVCAMAYRLSIYYLLLLNIIAFKAHVYCVWLLRCHRGPFIRTFYKYGGISTFLKVIVFECNVFLLALRFSNPAKKTAECNVVILHELGAVPFGPKYEPITVAMYCMLCMYMYHTSVLAHRAYKVQFVVRCCNITMMAYKLYLCLLLLCHGDIELNPGPSARALRAKKQRYYQDNKKRILSQKVEYYAKNYETIKCASSNYYIANAEARKGSFKKHYTDHAEARKASFKKHYTDHAEARKGSFKKHYTDHAEARKDSFKKHYTDHAEARKASFKRNYKANAEARKTSFRRYYLGNAECRKAYSKQRYTLNPRCKIAAVKRYDAKHKKERQAFFRNRYALAEPRQPVHEQYNKTLLTTLLDHPKVAKELLLHHKKDNLKVYKKRPSLLKKVVCSIASKKLVNVALAKRKEHAGTLLGVVRSVKNMRQIKGEDDFGEKRHCASSEPYFYDASYRTLNTYLPIPVTESGKCIVSHICPSKDKGPLMWECSSKCKPLSKSEIDAILSIREAFDAPMPDLRKFLHKIDSGCPYEHFSKSKFDDSVDRIGHPLVCYVGNHVASSACKSKIRMLRVAATHYPSLRNLLNNVYTAVKCHLLIYDLDLALHNGDYQSLLQLTQVEDFETLLNCDTALCSSSTSTSGSNFRRPDLGTHLTITHAPVIAEYEKELHDYHDIPCVCCERLCQRKGVTCVKLSDSLGSTVWPRIKTYILDHNPTAANDVLYICKYCKPIVRKNKLPPRCVLNGLEVVPIPPELAKLDSLSRQFIQLAKCYQTVVRLGTYTANVPMYNSLKALHMGKAFCTFLARFPLCLSR